ETPSSKPSADTSPPQDDPAQIFHPHRSCSQLRRAPLHQALAPHPCVLVHPSPHSIEHPQFEISRSNSRRAPAHDQSQPRTSPPVRRVAPALANLRRSTSLLWH